MSRHVGAKIVQRKRGSEEPLKQLNRITMTIAHQRGKHLNLQRRDIGEEADTIGDARLVRLQNIEHIADQVQRSLLNSVATKDNFLRVDPVGDGKRRLSVVQRSAYKAQDVSIPVMQGNSEPAAVGAGI
jgi:hypothetical protein